MKLSHNKGSSGRCVQNIKGNFFGAHIEYKNNAWIDESGYIKTRFYGLKVRVHRLIWAITYGPIPKGGVIHHRNGLKTDNRIENLLLLTGSDHAKLHHGTL